VLIVETQQTGALAACYRAVFGVHPADIIARYYDRRVVPITETASEFVGIHADLVRERSLSWLDVSAYGVQEDDCLWQATPPTLVVVRSAVDDLSHYWNLRNRQNARASSWVIPVPECAFHEPGFALSLASWLEAYKQRGDSSNSLRLTSMSVGTEDLKQFGERLADSLSACGVEYIDMMPTSNVVQSVIPFEHHAQLGVVSDGPQVTFTPPAPKVFQPTQSESWFVDLCTDALDGRSPREACLPPLAVISDILNAPCPPHSYRSVVPRAGWGRDAISVRCSSSRELIRMQVPTSDEVLEGVMFSLGCEIRPDEKRSSYLPVIDRFGGIHVASECFSGEGWPILAALIGRADATVAEEAVQKDPHDAERPRKWLSISDIKRIGRLGGGTLGDGHYSDRRSNHLRDAPEIVRRIARKRYFEYSRTKVPEDMSLTSFLNHWHRRGVVDKCFSAGRCRQCNWNLYRETIDFRVALTCDRCGNNVDVPICVPTVFSLNPVVRLAILEGVRTVTLTGRVLKNLSDKGFMWLPGVKYVAPDRKGDVDILACCDGHVVFSECKSLSRAPLDGRAWTESVSQVLALAGLARRIAGSAVVFAADVEEFPETVVAELTGAIEKHIPLLLLDRQSLAGGWPIHQGKRQCIQIDRLWNHEEVPNWARAPGVRIVIREGCKFTESVA
jgi:hypothetical protein